MTDNINPDIGFKDEKVIEEIIRRASSRRVGLTLITAPTGSGKSYDTSQCLAKHIAGVVPDEETEEERKKEIVEGILLNHLLSSEKDKRPRLYVTERRKNCNDVYGDIKERLTEAGREDLIADMLILPSYEDALTNEESVEILTNKNNECFNWEEAKALAATIGKILEGQKDRKNTDYLRRKAFGFDDEDFGLQESQEWAFRKRLKKELKTAHEEYLKKELTKQEQITGKKRSDAEVSKEIRKRKKEFTLQKFFFKKDCWGDKDWSFIEKLYPAAGFSSKKVLIMTTSKFLAPIDPIYEPSFYFHSAKDDLCILIDEIDDTKDEVLKNILGNIMVYDLVNLFGVMAKPILTNKVEGVIEGIIERHYKKRFENLKEEITSITNRYFPEKEQVKLFELAGNSLEPIYEGTNMLNYLGESWFFDSKMGYMYVPDKEEFKEKESKLKCNKICSNKDLKKLEKYSENGLYPKDLLNELRNCVMSRFTGLVADIAREYADMVNHKPSDKDKENEEAQEFIVGDKISDKAALTTVLKSLNFDDDNAREFAKITAIETANKFKKGKKKRQKYVKDKTFYGSGILLTYVVNNYEFRENTRLNSFSVPYTPEAFLANLALNYNVVGISATATHNGLHNYNMEYLKTTLGENFHEITEEEKDAIRNDYEKKTIGYTNHDIKTEINVVKNIDIEEDFYDDVLGVLKTIKNEEELTLTKKELRKISFAKEDLIIDTTREWFENKHDEILSQKDDSNVKNDYQRLLRIANYVAMLIKDCAHGGLSTGIILAMKSVGVLDLEKDKEKDEVNGKKENVKNNAEKGKEDNKIVTALTGEKEKGLLPKNPYSIPALQLFATYICMEIYGDSKKAAVKKAKDMFVSIVAADLKEDGYNSENKYEHFEKMFRQSKDIVPVFMVSTYASIARGNNLQVNIGEKAVTQRLNYPEERPLSLYEINPDRPVTGEVDWDSIYIDDISYIIPNIHDQKVDLLNFSTFTNDYREFLMKVLITIEECVQRRQISVLEKNKILQEVLITNAEKPHYTRLYSLDLLKIDKTVRVYQAIGRIARTNVKKKHNAVYISERLVNEVETDKEKLGIEIGSREFESFIKEVKKLQLEMEPELEKSEKKIAEKCKGLSEKLREFTHTAWTQEKMAYWEEVGRAFPLTHFSLDKTTLKVFNDYFNEKYPGAEFPKLSDFYVKVDKKSVDRLVKETEGIKYHYGFTKRGELRISFSGNFNKNYPFEVSEENSRLSALKHSDYIRDYFDKYAKEIKEYYKDTAGINDINCRVGTGFNEIPKINGKTDKDIYVLNPVAYTNLFKGGIGELTLQAYFEKNGLELEAITDPAEYEKFDFKIKDYPGFYVDAKNYGEETLAGDLANVVLKDKTKNKAELINAKHVFVINIIDPSTHRKKKTEPDAPITAIPGIFNEFCNDNLPEKKYNEGSLGLLELERLAAGESYESVGQKTAIEIVKDILTTTSSSSSTEIESANAEIKENIKEEVKEPVKKDIKKEEKEEKEKLKEKLKGMFKRGKK